MLSERDIRWAAYAVLSQAESADDLAAAAKRLCALAGVLARTPSASVDVLIAAAYCSNMLAAASSAAARIARNERRNAR